jgi:chaperonin GroES
LPERFDRLLAPALPTPSDVNVGDRVLFGKWSGIEVKIDGKELLIMKESDIMGVITDVLAMRKKAV